MSQGFYAAFLTAIAATASIAAAADIVETEKALIRVEVVADGLDHPWGMAFLPDGAVLVTERSGSLRIIANGRVGPPISGVPRVAARRQGGLLDVALHPAFATNQLVYLSYSKRGPDGVGTSVARGRLQRDGLSGRLADVADVFQMNRFTGSGIHFGSRLAFAPDGTLFVTVGERGDADRAQDPSDHAGSVVRINSGGSVPSDNPFVDGGGAPEIWSIGHRNPQGMAIRPTDGSVWIVEHGARGGDEINRPAGGKNYGWPEISYGRHYSGARIGRGTAAPGFEQPVYFWDPSIAPSGLDFYEGRLFPAWRGDLFVGALKFQLLVRLELEGNRVVHEERMLSRTYGRIRDVRSGPDGAIWLLTDQDNGKLLRLTPAH